MSDYTKKISDFLWADDWLDDAEIGDWAKMVIPDLLSHIDKLENQKSVLRNALAVFADKTNWVHGETDSGYPYIEWFGDDANPDVSTQKLLDETE